MGMINRQCPNSCIDNHILSFFANPFCKRTGRLPNLGFRRQAFQPVLFLTGWLASLLPYAQVNPLFCSGSVRIRFPVAAKIAFPTAGRSGGSVGSPSPVGA